MIKKIRKELGYKIGSMRYFKSLYFDVGGTLARAITNRMSMRVKYSNKSPTPEKLSKIIYLAVLKDKTVNSKMTLRKLEY